LQVYGLENRSVGVASIKYTIMHKW
jgi:hypothetical protein